MQRDEFVHGRHAWLCCFDRWNKLCGDVEISVTVNKDGGGAKSIRAANVWGLPFLKNNFKLVRELSNHAFFVDGEGKRFLETHVIRLTRGLTNPLLFANIGGSNGNFDHVEGLWGTVRKEQRVKTFDQANVPQLTGIYMLVLSLIDSAVEVVGTRYKLAKILGVSANRVNDWYARRVTCSPADQTRITALAKLSTKRSLETLVESTIDAHEGTQRGEDLKNIFREWLDEHQAERWETFESGFNTLMRGNQAVIVHKDDES